ncbi:OmpA family protein [Pseudomonas mangiferae]|uniref:OmpA family protein n=1 Tax=Pseudomonas mangiferae TaxID=2593654 RepID=A0A553H247_9PSED|nr:OmpA family protein [Pseudomonas mangiferae]
MSIKASFYLPLALVLAGCAHTSPSSSEHVSTAKHWWWPFGNETPNQQAAVAKPDPKVTRAWMDEYEPRLREALKDSKLELERRDDLLVVTAPVDSSFNPDRPSMLLPVTLGPFSRVAKLLEKDPKTGVLILGHADSSGQDKLNRDLSQQRAQAVAAIFRLSGLQRDRLQLKGLGSDMPRAANDSKEGRSLNRRVEILVTPQETLVAVLAGYTHPLKSTAVVVADQPKR